MGALQYRWAASSVWFLLVLMVAASCAPRPQAEPPAAEPEPEEPRYGGVLTRACIYGDPETLDPIYATRVAAVMHIMQIFDGLVVFNAEKGVIEPELAERWEVSADGLVYTFYLRQGVKFHNGREVTAEDVKYSLERVMDPDNASPHIYSFKSIKGAEAFIAGEAEEVAGIQVVDDYTLRIQLAEVDVTFLWELADVAGCIVPKEEVERLGDRFAEQPVGCGPFKFERWVRDSEVVYVAFEDYYHGRPYLDQIVARIIKEPATRELEFEAGRLDMFVLTDPQYVKFKEHPEYRDYLIEVPELFTRHIGFNCQREPFTDIRVRQAINYAIDREAIIETVLHGKAYPALGWYPPTNAAYNPEIEKYAYPYDPDKAAELLAEAGHPQGFTASILTTSHPAWGLPAVEAVMGYLAEVGITLKPELVEGGVLRDQANEGNYDMYIWSYGVSHPLLGLMSFHSMNWGPPGNRVFYKNDQVDALLDQARRAVDWDEMIRLCREAEVIIVQEAPVWFYNYNKAVMAYQPWVRGLKPIPTDMDYQPLHRVWISK